MADNNITAPAATAEDSNLAAEPLAKLQALPDVKRPTCLNYKLFVHTVREGALYGFPTKILNASKCPSHWTAYLSFICE